MEGLVVENRFINETIQTINKANFEGQVYKDGMKSSIHNLNFTYSWLYCVTFLDGSITWEYLIDGLLQLFHGDSVNIEEVEDLLKSYKSDPKDWSKYAKFDKYKYTRNLVHEGNGKFNLVSKCWR